MVLLFKDTLHIRHLPYEERLRQWLDSKDAPNQVSCNLIQMMSPTLQPSHKDFISIDLDVSPLDNSNSHKEGMSCTYKCFDGYAPMLCYLSNTGYMLAWELREGSQHSQDGTAEFLKVVIERIKKSNIEHPLVRMNSGNGAQDNVKLLMDNEIDFLIKRNPRKQKDQWVEETIQYGEDKGIRINPNKQKLRIYQHKETAQTGEHQVYYYSDVQEILEEKIASRSWYRNINWKVISVVWVKI